LRSVVNRVFLVCIALCLGILVFDANAPLGYAEWVLYLLPISLAFWRLRQRQVAYVASLSILFLGLGVVVSAPGAIPWQITFFNRVVGAVVISLTAFAFVQFQRMNQAQRESEEKYRAIVENSLDFIGVLQDGVLKYVNRAATKRVGWTYEELLSPSFDPIEKVVSERFRGLIKENLGKRLRGEDAPPYEISLTTRDGSEIPGIVRAAEIVYRGRPAIEFAFSDITERKRMENELSRSNQFLGSVIENAYVWLNVLDNEQNVIVWNKAAEAMSGYSRGEVVGHEKIWEWLYPDQEYRKQITETVNDILQSGRTDTDVETKIKRKDGQTRIISWNERALTDQDGKAIGTIAIGHDITEQKRMEEALRENEERFRKVFEEGPLGMALVRPDYRFARVNKALCTMLGYTEDELTSLKFTDITHPEDVQLGVELMEKMRRGEIPIFEIEKRYVKKNGEVLQGRLTASFIRDSKGSSVYSVAMIEDVTERKRMEERLTSLHEHALQLASAKGIDEIVKYTLDAIESSLGFDVADVYLAARDSLLVRGTRGAPIGLPEEHLTGRGLVAKAARTQATVRVSDTTKEPDYVDRKGWDWTGPHTMLSELAVPVVVDGETVAVLNAESSCLDAFSSEDQRLLETLAAHVGSEMQRLKHAQELENYSKHLEALVEERTKKLRQSEVRYRSVVQNIPGMVWTSNEKGDTVFITPNAKLLYGYTPEEIYTGGQSVWSKHIHPDDRVKVNEAYNALFTDGTAFDVEYRYQRPEGKWIWLHDSATVAYERNGVRYADGVTTDITERKQMEEDLRRGRERLEYIIGSNPAAVFTAKPRPDFSDYHSYFMSKNVTSLTGFRPQEIIGDPELWDERMQPDDRRQFATEVPALWKDGHHTFEYRFLHRNGNYRWIREEVNVIRDSKGEVRDLIGAWTDITDRKRMEEDILRSQRLAVIGETAAMVGHDLRNPLQGIGGAAYNIRRHLRNAPDPSTKEMLTVIDNGVEYANAIISDLLDYSREMQLQLLPTTPKSVVRQALMDIKVPENVRIQEAIAENAEILADEPKIRRVLTNLIENAIDAMPEGGTLSISSVSSGDQVSISVRDTGVGIPQDVMEKIWTPLYTTKAKGIGLGLPICKRIVEAHGGSISVESTVGKGSTFTVKLPAEQTKGGDRS
jgi:PAS domain S-box-containing protein